jgi:hypothetical protein
MYFRPSRTYVLHRHLIYLAVLCSSGCGNSSHPVSGPSFDVRIALSESARSQLESLGEDIFVTAYFDGNSWFEPMYTGGPFRAVFLGKQVVEVGLDEIAHFRGISFPAKQFADLTWRRYYVTINVVSSRHGSANNLLTCDVPEGVSSRFDHQLIEINCSPIRP